MPPPSLRIRGRGGEEKKTFPPSWPPFFRGRGQVCRYFAARLFCSRSPHLSFHPPSTLSLVTDILDNRETWDSFSSFDSVSRILIHLWMVLNSIVWIIFFFFLISINSWSSIISAATMRAFSEKLKKVSFFCLCFILYRVLSCKGTGFLSNGLSK